MSEAAFRQIKSELDDALQIARDDGAVFVNVYDRRQDVDPNWNPRHASRWLAAWWRQFRSNGRPAYLLVIRPKKQKWEDA